MVPFKTTRERCIVDCLGCGINFVSFVGDGQKYCTNECYRRNRSGNRNPNFRGGDLTLICPVCGKEFRVQRNGISTKKLCSDECVTALAKSRRKIPPVQDRLSRNVRRAILSYIERKSKGGRKWRDILGFGPVELMAHLQSLFLPGMTWENYGYRGWHIDHKKPVCSFQFRTVDDPGFKECWSLTNLQPLWSLENFRKGGRY